jgi:deazaflavin-dependent oxidoreductase (nitroreductase family)
MNRTTSPMTRPMDQIYPRGALGKLFYKSPLFFWRLGLGPLTGKIFLLLTTRGRKSGLPRATMVEYYRYEGKKYAIAAFGDKAQWYRNLLADPRVTIQTNDGTETATAVRVDDDLELVNVLAVFERHDPVLTRWYLQSLGIENTLEGISENKMRIHLLRFDPQAETAPRGLEVDLAWVWPLALILVLALRGRRN